MARLDATWDNFTNRGQAWDAFWGDSPAEGPAEFDASASDSISSISDSVGRDPIAFTRRETRPTD